MGLGALPTATKRAALCGVARRLVVTSMIEAGLAKPESVIPGEWVFLGRGCSEPGKCGALMLGGDWLLEHA